MKTIVWVQTQFEGFHRWKDAPRAVSFLRNFHRHIFKVKLGVEVGHGNREVEFFDLKDRIDDFLKVHIRANYFDFSCEMIAAILLDTFNASFVEVSEDGENGATVFS